jgi:hypothetical protein
MLLLVPEEPEPVLLTPLVALLRQALEMLLMPVAMEQGGIVLLRFGQGQVVAVAVIPLVVVPV